MNKQAGSALLVISNITLEPFFGEACRKAFAEDGVNIEIRHLSYEEAFEEKQRERLSASDRIAVWLSAEALYPDWPYSDSQEDKRIAADFEQRSLILYRFLKKTASAASILWVGGEDYAFRRCYALYGAEPLAGIDRVNRSLLSSLEEGDAFVDLKAVIARLGFDRAFDEKGKYRWNAPYSRVLLSDVAEEWRKRRRIENGISKKCLVLDCDNVLWGGILSEDGLENLKVGPDGLGRPYREFQRFVLALQESGVILALCSKNDEADVRNVLKTHDGMLLKEEHIACFCVNWEKKTDNLKRIAETLNISLESMVFVDDDEFEVQAARSILPEVTAVRFERETVYQALSCFSLSRRADRKNAALRNQTYQTDSLRKKLESECVSHEEFLRALEMKLEIRQAALSDLARLSELTQRTNRCTNGMRFTVPELKQRLLDSEYQLYAVRLSDRFSDLGLVGALGFKGEEADLFSLSCRAMGRGAEEKMAGFLKTRGVKRFAFAPTPKNEEWKKTMQKFLQDLV